MQTFLPYRSFVESAMCLDYRRLGKQRIECKQLLSALGYDIVPDDQGFGRIVPSTSPKKAGWANHPAAKMWKGYEQALWDYTNVIIWEWVRRGYNNTQLTRNPDHATYFQNPPWLGDEAFHSSHRSNLLRKDPVWYGKFGWTDDPVAEYIWPVVN